VSAPAADFWDAYDDQAPDYGYDDDPDCPHCGGRPDEQECDDPIQCCDPRCDGQWHPCVACNGTGRAKDQWLW
jgi:hypothetical protein